MNVTREMDALRAGLNAYSPISVKKWWIKTRIFPFIEGANYPWDTAKICEYFGISLNRFMFYKWQQAIRKEKVR